MNEIRSLESRGQVGTLLGLVALLVVLRTLPASGQSNPGAPIIYRNQEVFRLYGHVGAFTPEDRARLASERIDRAVRDLRFNPDELTVVHRETLSEFVLNDRVLGVVTDDDARGVGRPRDEYAEASLAHLKEIILSTREDLSARRVAAGLVLALAATLAFGVAVWLLRRGNRRAHRKIDAWRAPLARRVRLQDVQLVSEDGLAAILRAMVATATAGIGLALGIVWVQSVLAALPWTRPYAQIFVADLLAPLRFVARVAVRFVPNGFFLLVIAAIAWVLLRAIRLFFREVGRGALVFAKFPAEWADPTYKIVRLAIIALAFVAAFPYIPGSKSPAFQGVSLFLGLLVSLSSSSVIANVMAGTMITYTRAFHRGDHVRIGDTVGDVVDTWLLATQVRTPKNVVVSIPNSLVLAQQIINYTALAAGDGLILHTSVTIGYDAPWRRVHELLIAAARATDGVLQEPAPFVLQTGLNDFFVRYEINAYTRFADRMPRLYSALHANIQEKFNEGGVEIMSPHYLSLRDGNRVTIPADHLPASYAPAGFRIGAFGP